MFDLVFWPVNVLLTTSLLLSIAVMWSAYWRRATVYLRLFIESVSGVIVAFLLRSSELDLFESTGSAEIERVLPVMVMILRGLLWIVFVMILWELVKYGRIALRLGKLKD